MTYNAKLAIIREIIKKAAQKGGAVKHEVLSWIMGAYDVSYRTAERYLHDAMHLEGMVERGDIIDYERIDTKQAGLGAVQAGSGKPA